MKPARSGSSVGVSVAEGLNTAVKRAEALLSEVILFLLCHPRWSILRWFVCDQSGISGRGIIYVRSD